MGEMQGHREEVAGGVSGYTSRIADDRERSRLPLIAHRINP